MVYLERAQINCKRCFELGRKYYELMGHEDFGNDSMYDARNKALEALESEAILNEDQRICMVGARQCCLNCTFEEAKIVEFLKMDGIK